MTVKKKKEDVSMKDIESLMTSVEKIVESLEKDNASIAESLRAFEEGVMLIRTAQQTLAKAEQKVQLLLDTADGPESEEFASDNEDDF